MADTKITALTAITTVDPAADVLPIVDVSDTSMAASGTTKKITSNQILGAGGTATLASATITGNLTVNGSYISCGNNSYIRTDAANLFSIQTGSGGFRIMNAGNSALFYGIDSASTSTWYDGAGGTRMTLNATGLGVGVTPAAGDGSGVFKAAGTGSGATNTRIGLDVREITSGNAAGIWLGAMNNENTGVIGSRTASGNIAFQTFNGASWGERMRIDYLGNVGIGVTPSAWTTSYNALNIGSGGSVAAYKSANYDQFYIGSNFFENTSGAWRFINNGYATQYWHNSGSHVWRISTTSNAAGANQPLTWTQAMTLDASGNLLCGSTALNATWNTRLTLSSDSGTTRWAVGPYSTATNFVISAASGGGVYLNGTAATSWTSASDERLKDIIEPISNAIAKVGSLRAVIGKFKSDDTNTRKSFLMAQDVQSVLPEAVDASNPDRLGLAYTDVIPLLVAAIKELTARVQTLETR